MAHAFAGSNPVDYPMYSFVDVDGELEVNPSGAVRKRYSDPVKRFWSKVDKTDPNGCWLWVGGKFNSGYGCTRWQGKHSRMAHRIAYEIIFGSIPKGMFVCYACDNKVCVNPDHLFLGTAKDNSLDMMSKGRSSSCSFPGESNPNVKVSLGCVHIIRKLFKEGYSVAEIARRTEIPYGNAWRIAHGKSWLG